MQSLTAVPSSSLELGVNPVVMFDRVPAVEVMVRVEIRVRVKVGVRG